MVVSMKLIVRSILFLLVAMFVASAAFILHVGFSDNIHKSDVAIILGSKANPDGTLSTRLAARVNKGIELYRAGIVPYIIVSGGIDKGYVDEAKSMKRYLVEHHVPADVIFTDNHGHNTRATAQDSLILMQKHGFKSALVVSQYFHIARSRLALEQCNISPVYNAHANYFELRDVYSTVREVFGFYYYLLVHPSCVNQSNKNQ